MRLQYWKRMTGMKFEIQYLKCHHTSCISIERRISIILAVISTGSLAGLFVNSNYSIIFSIVLVLSQILTAAKPYLPYEYRINELEKGLYYYETIFSEVENYWNKINSNTEYNEDEVQQKLEEYLGKWSHIESSILKKDALPKKTETKNILWRR